MKQSGAGQTGRHADHRRYDQMFPTFTTADLDRLQHFGSPVSYAKGQRIQTQGNISCGLVLIRSGRIQVTAERAWERSAAIITHGPGQFQGELAQLSDRPAIVEAVARDAVEAILIPSHRLRDLMVQEAELGEQILRALILRRTELLQSDVAGPTIIGRAGDGLLLRLQDFLRRNGQPHRMLDPGSDEGARLLIDRFAVSADQLPIVLCPDGDLLQRPTESALAQCLGLVRPIDPSSSYDVAIIGAGPAGLSAAVYAGSEGLSVIVLDRRSYGGQAGASARIENYLGFPTGVSGMALTSRAYNQAQKFGVEFAIPDEACLLEHDDSGYILRLRNGETVRARVVVIASGADYRRLDLPELSRFEGASVHFWASPVEARLCAGQEVAIVGAGNSAGQAAIYLASQTRKVWLFARRGDLGLTMSRYLVQRIHAQPNIDVMADTEISGLHDIANELAGVRWRSRTGEEGVCDIRHLFLFIGADPNTRWLGTCGVDLDSRGFVTTGGSGHPLETNLAGVFAIGDVRAGSVKRVAAAVGEGAQVVAAIHSRLQRGASSTAPAATAGAS